MGTGRGVEEGGPPGMKAKILVNPTPYDAAPPSPRQEIFGRWRWAKNFFTSFFVKITPRVLVTPPVIKWPPGVGRQF